MMLKPFTAGFSLLCIFILMTAGCSQTVRISRDRRWQFEQITKDEKLTGLVAMDLDREGFAHVIYVSGESLKYALQSSTGWILSSIELPEKSIKSIKNMDFIIDKNGNGHLVFCAQFKKSIEGGFQTALYYGFKSGRQWRFGAVAKGAYGGSFILDSDEKPVIAYISVDRNLRIARIVKKKWEFEDVDDSDAGENLKLGMNSMPAVTSDNNGSLYCSYFAPAGNSIVFLSNASGKWKREIPYKFDSLGGGQVSLFIDNGGNPGIVCETSEGGNIALFKKRSSQWKRINVETSGDSVPVATKDMTGMISLSYFSYGYHELIYSQLDGDKFKTITVESKKGDKFFQVRPKNISMAFDGKNRPILVYSDPSRKMVCYFRKTRK